MNPKRMLSRAVGLVQSSIGALIMIFAFFIFYNIFDLQFTLGFPAEAIWLYLWSFIIFGLLSVISGLFLFYES
jgi:hypothetical protein